MHDHPATCPVCSLPWANSPDQHAEHVAAYPNIYLSNGMRRLHVGDLRHVVVESLSGRMPDISSLCEFVVYADHDGDDTCVLVRPSDPEGPSGPAFRLRIEQVL